MRRNRSLIPKCPNCNKIGKLSNIINGNFKVYYCSYCYNGFTFPIPKNINYYYPRYYWKNNTWLEVIKKSVFKLFQERRISLVSMLIRKGRVLDVGAGEGKYFLSLPSRYELDSQEPKNSKVTNTKIAKKDFLRWDSKKKYDLICFWESLEHTPSPQKYLDKAYSLLKSRGKIIIEYPRFDSWEAKLFRKYWFHIDTPRHLAHFSEKGITTILTRVGFKKVKTKPVYSIDYAPWGLLASIFNIVGVDITNYFKKTGNLILFTITTPAVFIFSIIEFIFYFLGQSPISVATAEKK